METEFQKAVGKGIGEVMRDIADFLSTPFIINEERQLDLCTLIPDLNMHEQFSFALLSEARTQGWSRKLLKTSTAMLAARLSPPKPLRQ